MTSREIHLSEITVSSIQYLQIIAREVIHITTLRQIQTKITQVF